MENEKDPKEEYANWKAPETTDNTSQDEGKLAENQVLNHEHLATAESPETEILASERAKFEAVSEALRSLTVQLRQREQDRFNQLITEQNLSRLASAGARIEELSGNANAKTAEFEESVSALVSALKTFGDVPRERGLRDNVENLSKINFRLNQLRDATLNIRSALGGREQESLRPLLSNLIQVDASLEKIRQWIAKKASILGDYESRRY